MEGLITKENWSKVKARLIEEHAILTEKNLDFEEGKEDKLMGTLQERLGKTKSEVSAMLRSYIDES